MKHTIYTFLSDTTRVSKLYGLYHFAWHLDFALIMRDKGGEPMNSRKFISFCCWLEKLSYIKMQMKKKTEVKTLSNSSNWSFRKQCTAVVLHNHFEDRQFSNVTPLHVYQVSRKKMSACKSPSSKSAYVCTKYFLLAPYKLQRFLYADEWDLICIIQHSSTIWILPLKMLGVNSL